MTRRGARLAALLLAGLAPVAAPAQKAAPAGDARAAAQGPAVARGSRALLRGLDKISGATTDIDLATGEAATFGRLEVRLGECRYPADDPDSDAFAELTITDAARGGTVFAGWMIASSPALSALDDARYDVWVISCSSASAAGSGPASAQGSDSAAPSSE